jgi:two-component system nitrogen regulation sensor histidine kinase NtrY
VATVTITDNGPGLSPQQIQQVWLPYVSMKKGGSGLGLPVVKKIIETMQGSITMQPAVSPGGLAITLTLRTTSPAEKLTNEQ